MKGEVECCEFLQVHQDVVDEVIKRMPDEDL